MVGRRVRRRVLVSRFWRLAAAKKALLLEAAFFLLLSRTALVALPFRRIATRLGVLVAPSAAPATALDRRLPEQAQVATDVGWAVARAARYVPFEAVCLPQAMTAKLMLERRGVACTLHLGASRRTAAGIDFQAHAWLDAVGVKVTGYPVAQGFVEIACFV